MYRVTGVYGVWDEGATLLPLDRDVTDSMYVPDDIARGNMATAYTNSTTPTAAVDGAVNTTVAGPPHTTSLGIPAEYGGYVYLLVDFINKPYLLLTNKSSDSITPVTTVMSLAAWYLAYKMLFGEGR